MNKCLFLLIIPLFLSALSFGQWNETDKIVASDRQPNDFFGGPEDAVSIYGDYAVVGSSRADFSGFSNAGAAYVYKRDNNCNWNQIQKLTADVPASNDLFGNSVAIYGEFIVIGAMHDDDDENNQNFLNGSGGAYVFRFNGSTWLQTQKIVASDREAIGIFGRDVDISGRKIIVGSWGEDSSPLGVPNSYSYNSGAAYIFEFDGNNWLETQKLVASDRDELDYFGWSVAISNDYAVVGAIHESEDANGATTLTGSGSAYIFEKTNVWTEVQKITSSDRGANEKFAEDVDIDGSFIIVGVSNDYQDENGVANMPGAGSAFIFERSTLGLWQIAKKIDADDRANLDWFGTSVSITKEKAVVGARNESHDTLGGTFQLYAGSAYVFELNGTWGQTQKIVASDRFTYDYFGQSVAINDDRIIVGAYLEDEDNGILPSNTMSNAGSAYIFEVNTPASQPTITASNASFCLGSSITMTISTGILNDAVDWQWYAGSCNSAPIGTGLSITVSPSGTTTYYVNGVGGCVNPGLCGLITLTENTMGSWHQTTKYTQGGDDINRDVITDQSGNVYVTGSFSLETTLDGGSNIDLTMNTGVGNQIASYIAKYSPCGDLLWESHAIGSKYNQGNSITLDEVNETVYIGGDFENNLQFTSSVFCGGTPTIYASGAPNGYIAAFKMIDGCILSLSPVINTLHTTVNAITINEANGDLFVGGQTSSNYSGSPYTSYIHKYQPSVTGIGGVISDINSFAGNYNNKVNDMDYDENNLRLWVVGDFEEKVKFIPGAGVLYVQSLGQVNQDAYLLSYSDDPGGLTPMLIRRGNATKFMSGEGISIDQITGDPYFTGTFQNIVDAPFQYGTINNLPNFSENSAYLIGLDINTFNGWSRYANAPFGNTYGKSVVFKDNHVFYTGNYSRNDIDIELIGSFPYITSGMPINNHIFIACYESPGGGVWGNVTTDPVSNTGVHNAMSITANNQGKAFVVGSYFKAMDYFMTSSSPQLNSTGIGNNGFILRVEINTGNLFIVNDEPLVKLNDKTISSLEIAIAPNPTSGQANCVIQNYDSRKAYQIKIHDPLGKIIYESSPTFGTFNIDLSNQKNGLYFIQLYDGTLTTYTKIVKTD